ncbi:MAG: hypothetical protein LBU76_10555 [Azoarcus sp.]|nr:hypothetical protein [Azoarcus sp.]
MKPDGLAVEIRARSHWEATDLGLALVQAHWRSLYSAWLAILLPVIFLEAALLWLLSDYEESWPYIPILSWWLKPLYDRVLLHVLSRAVFGVKANWRDVLRALPRLLLHSGLFRALTIGRLSTRRSFRLPVWQLEGVSGKTRKQRFCALWGHGAARLFFLCIHLELILFLGIPGLLYLLLPTEFAPSLEFIWDDSQTSPWFFAIQILAGLLAMSIIEPFYVAAGFMLYLNRRTEIEGWDIELGFRTLAARLNAQQAAP